MPLNIKLLTRPVPAFRPTPRRRHLESRFDSVLAKPPIATVREAPRCEVDPLLYTPPALRPGGKGWFPEHSKAWLGWGAPREGL